MGKLLQTEVGIGKLDWRTLLEYFARFAEAVSRGYLPSKFLRFGLVGTSGLIVHLTLLRGLLAAGIDFDSAQSLVIPIVMVWTYSLNNTLTHRDRRLVGWAALRGLISFMAICGFGGAVNVLVARDVFAVTQIWFYAGISGAAVGAVINYSLTSMFTWGRA
jgi:dolichol-phosphate mannosyltransferase